NGNKPIIKKFKDRKYVAWVGVFSKKKNPALLLDIKKLKKKKKKKNKEREKKKNKKKKKKIIKKIKKQPNIKFFFFLKINKKLNSKLQEGQQHTLIIVQNLFLKNWKNNPT